LNGIQEVSGSIPLSSTTFLPKFQNLLQMKWPARRRGLMHCLAASANARGVPGPVGFRAARLWFGACSGTGLHGAQAGEDPLFRGHLAEAFGRRVEDKPAFGREHGYAVEDAPALEAHGAWGGGWVVACHGESSFGCGDLACAHGVSRRVRQLEGRPGCGGFSGEICVGSVIDGFRRYRSTAPNIAEIAENKKRTN
jgi:hypothetical protein